MTGLKIKVEEMKGEAILLKKCPIVKVGSIAIPEGKSGQRVRLQVMAIGPDVNCCEVDDFVVVSPLGPLIQFNPIDSDEVILAEQKYILAKVSYEESLIEVANPNTLITGVKN